MKLDIHQFYKAANLSYRKNPIDPQGQKHYINLSTVRGEPIDKIKRKITVVSPDRPTCDLFTGHIGCGKSTELLRLKMELEAAGFHVVYFEATEDLESWDVETVDILLAIARHISQSLDSIALDELPKLKELLQKALEVVNADEIHGNRGQIPGVENREVNSDANMFCLHLFIGEIMAKTKNSFLLHRKLTQFLYSQINELIDAINQELISPAIAKLQERGKQGLVAIVDNLDRIEDIPKPGGTRQQEYLFVDRGEYLHKLHCHLVYTIPRSLLFSNRYDRLCQIFGKPIVLPMVPVQFPDGREHKRGMALLRQMVLAQVFPDLNEEQRLEAIPQMFDSAESLDRLCRISGGHIRNLLSLLSEWIREEMQAPLRRKTLETSIESYKDDWVMALTDEEWQLLRQVRQGKELSEAPHYKQLIRSLGVFEYYDRGEVWFDVNPILAEAKQMQ